MQLLFEAHAVPEDCRRPIAESFLTGPALIFWAHAKEAYGPNPSLHDLNVCLSQRYQPMTNGQFWDVYASDFKQQLGEGIVQFGIRFEVDLLETCPHPLSEIFMMQLYRQGLREEYRLPLPAAHYGTFEAMRAAHDLLDDEVVLHHAPGPPPAPVPVAPVPVPPHAEALAVPVDPVPPVDPIVWADPVIDPASPSEDTDPSEYSAEEDYKGHGEGDIEVDWDPAADPVVVAHEADDVPAPAGPAIAPDPEDVAMDADDVDAGDDYIADLGAP